MVTEALSLTVFHRKQQRYRQTDGRTDGQNRNSNSRPDAARYALASVAKSSDVNKDLRFKAKAKA